ncbi:anthrax toxin receptor-like isoform X4 [Balaenoptera acutorostrata]|uniref:Anthrax toxin receptor-like isoform X4 n=1 Tax=Balaenoptera acutorostrata TaxID=9767 RepID=A0ABM3SCF8_BALAC|nr:anthrax toxin receptor-like isoform X4 [Balaenoptera acutorostrata]
MSPCFLPSPNLRMSLITYSSYGNVVLKLTSDRNELKRGLKRLRDVVPSGPRNMQAGLRKANEQISRVFYNNRKAASLVYALTAGPLLPSTLGDAKNEASRLRNMKTKVYCLGVKDYQRDQLIQIVEGKTHMYDVPKSSDKEGFIISLVGNSCKEVMGGDTFYACVRESYQLGFYAYGLSPDRMKDYTCRYKLDKTEVFTKPPNSVTEEKIICPGHIFLKAGQVVVVDYSLDLGNTWSERSLKITSKDCIVKEPPPAQKPEKKPCPVQTRVIVSCCGCQEDRIKQMEGKLDTFYDFVQHCSQVPLMWCPPRDTGRCTNFTLMNPHCTQMFCGPKICLQPSQECFPLSSCCSHGQHLPPTRSQSLSRMLPLIPPTAWKLCRSTLSLPPP